MGQRAGEIHAAPAAEANFGFLIDQAFAQRCEGGGKLNGRAGLRSAGEREFLVHHGEDAATGRFDCYHRTVQISKSFDCGLADDGIFSGRDIAIDYAVREGTGIEAFVIAAAANPSGASVWGAAFSESPHTFFRMLAFADRRRLASRQRPSINAGSDAACFQQQRQPYDESETSGPTEQLHWHSPEVLV